MYYRCSHYDPSCKQRGCIREEALEEQIVAFLGGLQLGNPRLLEWVRKALKESHSDEISYHEAARSKLETEYRKLQSRMDRLYEDKLDEVITKDLYERKSLEYQKQQQDINEQLERHRRANVNYLELGSYIFELAQAGAKLYETAASSEQKRSLLHIIFSNLSLKGGNLVPTYQNGFQLVANCAKTDNWLLGLDSNQ